ncbi:CLUMA_CG018171, isoform A [Clunio marinus]|uniref:CLUMA_CG018171, isoform A n=1 Tax=Clunio marinus TaxID=568069 RepID=A0A1J1IXW5_9DIPT|nr:CLUMA_CG018171, isoform A [Clunio marinus]
MRVLHFIYLSSIKHPDLIHKKPVNFGSMETITIKKQQVSSDTAESNPINLVKEVKSVEKVFKNFPKLISPMKSYNKKDNKSSIEKRGKHSKSKKVKSKKEQKTKIEPAEVTEVKPIGERLIDANIRRMIDNYAMSIEYLALRSAHEEAMRRFLLNANCDNILYW